jgi:hypothetical protein
MKVPKAKNKTVMSKRLHRLDGVRDLQIGPASVEARERGNAHVTGQGVEDAAGELDDIKARNERYGLLY